MIFEGPPPDIWEKSSSLTPDEIETIKAKASKTNPDGDALWQFAALIIDRKVELTTEEYGDDCGTYFAIQLLEQSSADYRSAMAAYLLSQLGLRLRGHFLLYDEQSLQWLMLACERGHAKAFSKLGDYHHRENNYGEAALCYQSGCKLGDASATLSLAEYYAESKGNLPFNPRLARKLALLAARRNCFRTVVSLQEWLGQGLRGVTEKDLNLVLYRAARLGDIRYAYQLVMKVHDAETAKEILIPPNVAARLQRHVDELRERRFFYQEIKYLLALHRCYTFGIGGVEVDSVEAGRILYQQIPSYLG